jgi:hypothetical protein
VQEQLAQLIGGEDVPRNGDRDGACVRLEGGLDVADGGRHAELEPVGPRLPGLKDRGGRRIPRGDVCPFILRVREGVELPFV